MNVFFKERIERKRKINECENAIQIIRATDITDMVFTSWPEDDILLFLVAKYGFHAVELGRYAKRNFPPTHLCPKEMKMKIGLLSVIASAGVPENDAQLFADGIEQCETFLTSNISNVSYSVITPPKSLIEDGCLNCGSALKTHNDSTSVTVFTVNGPIASLKISWRCQTCGINFNYSQYGNKEMGYKFYKKPRPLIEASNVAYVERLVCKYQINMANHAWVSFEGFAEAYNCATNGVSNSDNEAKNAKKDLDRRIVSSAFYQHEVEDELRDRKLIDWVFKGEKEETLDHVMSHIDSLRCSELYKHPTEDCSDFCKDRGCENFVSMDGIWKLRFPHCMYPVKTEVSGLEKVNFPDVCPREPMSRHSAFCKEHCEIADANNVPTDLRGFLHDFCGVPRYDNVAMDSPMTQERNHSGTDVQKVESKRAQLPIQKSSSLELTKLQGTSSFLSENKGLYSVKISAVEDPGDPCNKDTGDNQKTLQKWSRGLLHFVRGGGHIERWNPLFKSESPGQVFLLSIHYLYERLKLVPESDWEKFILSYDNMCNLCNLRAAREPLPLPAPYDQLWEKVKKVIDRLHLRNHKNPRCHVDFSCEPLRDQYPHLNTMVAEQTFVWSSRFKKILNAMPMRRFLFYYHRMVVHRNRYTAHCHKQKKEPVLPKVR